MGSSFLVFVALCVPAGPMQAPGRTVRSGRDPSSVPQMAAGCPRRPKSAAKARALARKWFLDSVALYRKKRYKEAYRSFLCTQSILPADLTRYWIARSAQDAGLLEEAKALFLELKDAPPEPVTKKEIMGRLRKIETLLAKRHKKQLMLRTARLRGHRKLRRVDWTRVGVAVLLGVSAACLGASVVTGGLAGYEGRRIETAKDGTWWDPDLRQAYGRRKDLLVATWVTLGIGLVGSIAASAYLVLHGLREKQTPRAWIRPRQVGLSVEW